jgi:hypothetical protein
MFLTASLYWLQFRVHRLNIRVRSPLSRGCNVQERFTCVDENPVALRKGVQ